MEEEFVIPGEEMGKRGEDWKALEDYDPKETGEPVDSNQRFDGRDEVKKMQLKPILKKTWGEQVKRVFDFLTSAKE